MSAVDLYWIPLGTGASVVRCNGVVYEAISALVHRRARTAIVHTALVVTIDDRRCAIEMTPVPDAHGDRRGVVAGGAVGLRWLGRLRLFRYEVRRWLDGTIPDLDASLTGPVRVTGDLATARRVLELLPSVPTPTWGRDELGTGEMWTCNSITAWVLAAAGIDVGAVSLPPGTRAPGWAAGIAVATR